MKKKKTGWDVNLKMEMKGRRKNGRQDKQQEVLKKV